MLSEEGGARCGRSHVTSWSFPRLPSACREGPNRCRCRNGTSSTATRSSGPILRAWKKRCSVSGVSGEPSACSGRRQESGSPPSATPEVQPPTRPTRRSAADAPGTPRPCVVYDPKLTSYETLLKLFWESHDPTQGMRQGNDVGTQYRSAIYTFSTQQASLAEASRSAYQRQLQAAGLGEITTEIREAPPFYFAEDYHQQYLAKNPYGYCGLGGTGVSCPLPAKAAAD